MTQDQYGTYYTQYDQYGPYGQNEEYNEYRKYGECAQCRQKQGMEDEYLMSGNLQNRYKKYKKQLGKIVQQNKGGYSRRNNSGIQKKLNKSFHVCPVHGLFGQGKQGNKYGYIETLKEIRKFKGTDGGEGGIRKISRGYRENMGGRKKEKKYEYIQEKINNIKEENEKEVDNYKFYESRNLSKKKVNNSLNIVNSENNMTGSGNIIGERTRSGIGLSQKMKTLQLIQSMHSKQGKQSMQSMGMGMQG